MFIPGLGVTKDEWPHIEWQADELEAALAVSSGCGARVVADYVEAGLVHGRAYPDDPTFWRAVVAELRARDAG